MKQINKILLLVGCLFTFFACSEDKLGESIINIPEQPTSEADIWIYENLTKPHNIDVIYRWVDAETDLGKNLVPPLESKVIPFLSVIKQVWIDVYVKVGGLDFFNELRPNQIQLIGSASYNSNGTITQGTAEGGLKIVLYEVNEFDKSNVEKVKRFFHVIHHEYAHIIHQHKMYNKTAFSSITPTGYRNDWSGLKDAQAWNSGFITPYSCMNPDEDFVEMIATILTTSRADFDQFLDSIEVEEGRKALRKKEKFIVSYFQKEWSIDLYEFQTEAVKAMEEVVNS